MHQELGIPFVYVRSAEKKHGLENKVEGVVNKGDKVVVIEDLVSTGQSSLDAVETLRAMGCNVLGMVAIFTYNLPISVQRFQEANVELHTLTNYNILVPEAAAEGYVKESDIEVLNAWSKNPALWSEQHQ